MSAETDDIHVLAAAYALDALPPDEEAFFERHLATCADCTQAVAEHREVAAELALGAAEEPPAGLRDRVFAEIDATPQEQPAPEAGPPAAESGASVTSIVRTRAFLQGVAAAFLVAVLGVAGVAAFLLGDDAPDTTLALDETFLATADSVRLEGPEGTAATFYYSHEQDEGWLVVDGLDPLDPELDYQLWLFHDEVPVPAGVFVTDDGRVAFRADAQVRDAQVVAVTVEPAGGLPEPSGPVVLSAPLEA